MGSILLKNVPGNVHSWLKREAERNRRSMHQQAIACLEQASMAGESMVYPEPRSPAQAIAEPAAALDGRAVGRQIGITVDAGLLESFSDAIPNGSSLSACVEEALRSWLGQGAHAGRKRRGHGPFTKVIHGGTTRLPKTSSTGAWLDFIDGQDGPGQDGD